MASTSGWRGGHERNTVITMSKVGHEHHPVRGAPGHCLAPARMAAAPLDAHRYTRMFPELPHLSIDLVLLRAIGGSGGACDSTNSPREESRSVAAGWPVFGQFIAHDITADRSPVGHHDDETLLRNVRSARLDLECVYGD